MTWLGRIAVQNAELKAELDALKRISEGSPKYGKGALLEAFRLCGNKKVPLPLWLARAIDAELMRGASKQAKHFRRWREVRKMRDTRPLTLETAKMRPGRDYSFPELPVREIGYDETFEMVSDKLRKTSARGAAKSIERSYDLVENDLPEGLRYKRTYTKRLR